MKASAIRFFDFLRSIVAMRRVLARLIWQDFKKSYLGSYLGLFWAFAQPVITIMVFWFVFSVGLRGGAPREGVPFILWFVSGMIPWFFFQGSLSSGTNSIRQNQHLVQKIVFRVSLLPIVKLATSMIIHLVLVTVMIGLFLVYGVAPQWYSFQIIFYLIYMVILLLGMTWLTSALSVFVQDVTNVIAISLQLLFWMTPIIWPLDRVPEQYQVLFKINPVYYVSQGYRNSMISQVGFWEDPYWALYYWGLAGFLFLLGASVFSKLRPHFADVL